MERVFDAPLGLQSDIYPCLFQSMTNLGSEVPLFARQGIPQIVVQQQQLPQGNRHRQLMNQEEVLFFHSFLHLLDQILY